MKATLNEYGTCFEIVLTPETIEDQAKIIRIGLNNKKEIRSISSYVHTDLSTRLYLIVGAKKRKTSTIRNK